MGGEHSGVVVLERDGALSTLEAAFGEVLAGRGGVALVSGEAGIGKSSLVQVFVAAEGRATRVLAGACDDLAVPRPLGPFLDMAGELPGLASELRSDGVDAGRVVLDELGRDGATICVVEDAHWADEATIDVLTFVVRRVEALSVLLVVSFRDDEVGPDHPLRRALAAMPPGRTHRLELERLSVQAVAQLAGADVDAASLHAITGGNPFIEWVTADAEELPFESASFDVVMPSIGVMFAPRHQRAADELVRVCRPASTIALLSWTPGGMIGAMFATMKPFAAPPPPGAQSPPLWGSQEHVAQLFGQRVTFGTLRRDVLENTAFAHPHDYAEHLEAVYGPTIAARANAAREGREGEFDAALDAFCDDWNRGTDQRARFEMAYLLAVGTREPQ